MIFIQSSQYYDHETPVNNVSNMFLAGQSQLRRRDAKENVQ